MSASTPASQRPSPFGAAAFRKAIDVVAHYVDFSDHSSSWSGSQSGDEGTETPDKHEELRTPLLQSQTAPADDSAATPDVDQHTRKETAQVEVKQADRLAPVSQNPQVDVQRQQKNADASSSSNDGAETPTKEDLRAPLLPSQPMEQETHTQASSLPSPKVPAASGLDNLGSGLLDPSLVQRLLDDDASPPDMPSSPIRHAEPVAVPPNGNYGMHQLLNAIRYALVMGNTQQ